MSGNQFYDRIRHAENIGCSFNREQSCEYAESLYLCKHPALKWGEPISDLPYCPKDKYSLIHGKAVFDDDLDEYKKDLINNCDTESSLQSILDDAKEQHDWELKAWINELNYYIKHFMTKKDFKFFKEIWGDSEYYSFHGRKIPTKTFIQLFELKLSIYSKDDEYSQKLKQLCDEIIQELKEQHDKDWECWKEKFDEYIKAQVK